MQFSSTQSGQFASRHSLTRAMTWHASLSNEFIERLWNDPESLTLMGDPLQDKERCLVVRLDDGPDSAVLKRHNWGGLWKTTCKSLRTPQARQSFRDGVYLAAHGVRTPLPLALVERKLGPFGRHSYLLSEYVRGTSLYRMMRFERPPVELVCHIADQVVALLARLVELRVSHNDLKPENLMIDAAGQVWLIDLEKFRRHTDVEQAQVRLVQDLNRFLHPRNWSENRAAMNQFRERLARHPAIAAAIANAAAKKHFLLDAQGFEAAWENRLSVLIVSPTTSAQLQTCIEAIRDIADEVVVADDQTNPEDREPLDHTECRWLTPGEGEANAAFFNRALAETRHPWVLIVQGRERVSPDLAKEIQCVLATDPQVNAFRISRRHSYLGHVSRFGAIRNTASVRLVRRGSGNFVDHRLRTRLHAAPGQVGRLNSKLIDAYCVSVAELVSSLNDRSTRLAQLRYQRAEQPKLLRAAWRAARRFLGDCLVHHVFLDGRVGLQMSLQSACSVLLTEMKLWELHYSKTREAMPDGSCGNVGRLFRESEVPEQRPPDRLDEASRAAS